MAIADKFEKQRSTNHRDTELTAQRVQAEEDKLTRKLKIVVPAASSFSYLCIARM